MSGRGSSSLPMLYDGQAIHAVGTEELMTIAAFSRRAAKF
jgi:hypothetical protein